jgi:drug/metabolite transporter (DMT)-like permease
MLQTNSYLKGAFFCLMAAVAWGTSFPMMTQVLYRIDPFTFTFIRYSAVELIFLGLLYFQEGPASFKLDGNLFLLWFFGTMGFTGFGFLVFFGQKMAGPEGALTASMMMAMMPLLGLFVIWGLKGERPPVFSFGFILLSVLGVLLVITKGHLFVIFQSPENYFSNMLMLVGVLGWVFYTMGAEYFPHWSPVKYSTMSLLFSLPTMFLIILVLIHVGYIVWPTMTTLFSLSFEFVYMTFVAGFIGVFCWNHGNKIITPINAVLFMNVIPITAFVSSLLHGIIPEKAQLIGMVITIVALILNNYFQRRRMVVINNPIPKAFEI